MKYWRIQEAPDPGQSEEIARLLASGGVVVLPTDTIYGLHALAKNQRALAAIRALKSRDPAKPFLILASSIDDLEELGIQVPENARAPLREIWPAPLTVILPLREPLAASQGLGSIGVRVPALSWLRALIERTGPLASTSANESGDAPAVSPSALPSKILSGVEGVVDGGSLEGNPSTIIDLSGEEPRLVRSGEPLFTQEVWKTLRKTL